MLASLAVAALSFSAPLAPVRSPVRASDAVMAADNQIGKAIGATFLAAVLTMAPVTEAFAAGRSGGRVGGRAPSMSRSVSRSAPAPQRTTNVYVAPAGGMGYGMGYGGYGMGGGFGISPGAYLGLSLAETFIREQQRQAYLQQQLRTQQELGRDQAQIQQLQQALMEQNAKVEGLRAQQATAPAAQQAAPAPASDAETVKILQQQLMMQQQQIQQLQQAK
mmetsp:Transcript_5003/g.13220  ORF Transcript_5003/g.13220 Transcript_5003/m.13220 type:complete len:220 (-) Transcript_5003:315-974(-)